MHPNNIRIQKKEFSMHNIRKFIFIIVLLLPTVLFSQSKKIARWSLTAEYGYNYFDGDINQRLQALFPTSFRNATYGINLDYNLTPAWSIGLDAYHFPLRASNNSPIPININTDLNSGSLMGAVNLSKLFFPRKNYKLSFSIAVGVGYAHYTYDVRNQADNSKVADGTTYIDNKYNGQVRPVLLVADGKVLRYGAAVTNPVVISMEYNFSKPFAIGAKVHYRSYAKDNLEGVTYLNWNGVTNDYIGAGTIYLRYKIGSIKRDHLMNISTRDWEPEESLQQIAGLKGEMDAIKSKVEKVEKKVDAIIPRLDKLEAMISNVGPDSDNDGVIDIRDLDPNTAPNTAVDFHGRPLPIMISKSGDKTYSTNAGDEIPSVYFDFDKITLDDLALVTISKIAQRMQKDQSLLVEVRGYTDYLGDAAYNEKLSLRRAERVKKELVTVWGIEDGRIIANGKGKVIQPQVQYRPNRRCDFFFSNDIVDILNQ